MRRLFPVLLGLFICRALAQNALSVDDMVARNIKARGGMTKLAGLINVPVADSLFTMPAKPSK